MPKVLVTTRAISRQECPWLDADIPAGTSLWTYDNHTYGCITPGGVAVSARAAETPFFEVPKDAVMETAG